jgi:hypothetical protein
MNISIADDKILIELPQLITIDQPYFILLAWWLGIFVVSMFLKFIGRGPNIKAGIISALSILIMYVACVLIYKYEPVGLDDYLAPLPFVQFNEDSLVLTIYELNENGKFCVTKFCNQILSMFILAFFVNQIYAFKPGNLKSPGWLIFRLFSTLFCIGFHYAVHKVLTKVIGMIPKDNLVTNLLPHLAIGFLCFLVLVFILASIKPFLKFFVQTVNPTFEGLSGFFYVNKFGVIVTRAIYTTILLSAFAYDLQRKCEQIYMAPAFPFENLHPQGFIVLGAVFFLWLILGRKL